MKDQKQSSSIMMSFTRIVQQRECARVMVVVYNCTLMLTTLIIQRKHLHLGRDYFSS